LVQTATGYNSPIAGKVRYMSRVTLPEVLAIIAVVAAAISATGSAPGWFWAGALASIGVAAMFIPIRAILHRFRTQRAGKQFWTKVQPYLEELQRMVTEVEELTDPTRLGTPFAVHQAMIHSRDFNASAIPIVPTFPVHKIEGACVPFIQAATQSSL
jgi:hypothetical protein